MKDEANEFLSKLKKRVEQGKGKREGKDKKNGGKKQLPSHGPTKHATPTKQSPCGSQQNQVGMSLLTSDIQASPRGFQPHSTLPRGHSPRGDSPMQRSPRGFENRIGSPILVQEGCISDCLEQSPPMSPVLVVSPQTPNVKRKGQDSCSSPGVRDFCGYDSRNHNSSGVIRVQQLDSKESDDVEIIDASPDKTDANIHGALSIPSSPRDVMSPPVPSPDYTFMDRASCPGSPMPCTSPVPQNIVLSPDPTSPTLPVDCKPPASKSGLGTCPQSNSPESPSVCSFSSEIPTAFTQRRAEVVVRKLDLGQRVNDKGMTKTIKVKEFDPNIPLMERLRAARNGEQKFFKLQNVVEDSSDSNSDDGSTKDEIESKNKTSQIVSPQQHKDSNTANEMKELENISVGSDFDFYDDGGYNFDIEELNKLENCMEVDIAETNLDKQEEGHSKDKKPLREEKGAKVAGKRKIPPSQRRVEDSDDEDKTPEASKKRGKKTDSQSYKPAGQTVSQPVTPMPDYHDMATPLLKVCDTVSFYFVKVILQTHLVLI